MVTWKDFTLNVVQTSAFTPDHAKFSSGKAVGAVLSKFRDRFDGEMQVLPFGAEVPPEVFRVVLQSGDGRWRLSMAPARIDCVTKEELGAADLDAAVEGCVEVLRHYADDAGAVVDRIALVTSRTSSVENPAQTLIQRFCNSESQVAPLNNSKSFEIHNHKIYTIPNEGGEFRINSWVRCKSARLVADATPVILVEQDLNTVVNETQQVRFSPDQISGFFNKAKDEADEIFRKYFPG